MRLSLYFLFFTCIFSLQIGAENTPQPLSIVIVGAGPAGLATAIEARSLGAQVIIVEKRESSTRAQTLFLQDSSLDLLKKWHVHLSQMHVVNLQNKQIGVVPIHNLEEGLKKRVQELGIQILYGEFQHFQDDKAKTLNILQDGKEVILPYDIVVAADGAHSRVRDALGVECNIFGEVNGFSAFISISEPEGAFGISDPIKTNGFFLRKIGFSTGSIIFAQRILDPHAKEAISEKEFQELLKSCHLNKEYQSLIDGKADVLYNITITLQQADQFSDEEKGAIIVGDAAATASFFKGMGANTALKTASLAGEFFSKVQQHDRDSYATFNLKMKEATDALINDSKFLFISE